MRSVLINFWSLTLLEKGIIFAIVLIVVAIAIPSVKRSQKGPSENTSEALASQIDREKEIGYLKDHRTGLCFAIVKYRFVMDEGVQLVRVPCDRIPDKLLD